MNKSPILIEVGEMCTINLCRRCVYAIAQGERIGVIVSKNGSRPCGHCGKVRKTPYSASVQIVRITDDTGNTINAEASIIEIQHTSELGRQMFS